MSDALKITEGSGNVFRDLELPDAETLQLKAELGVAIARVILERKLTQSAAAELTGMGQPKISAIVNGRLEGFSVERLIECLRALKQDVVISIGPAELAEGRVLVHSR